MAILEDFRDEIVALRETMTLEQVRQVIKEKHGIDRGPKHYKQKLDEWGSTKNIPKKAKLAILLKVQQEGLSLDTAEFYLDGKLVPRQKYLRLKKTHPAEVEAYLNNPQIPNEYWTRLRYQTPLHSPISTPEQIRAPEYLLNGIHNMIWGLCQANKWRKERKADDEQIEDDERVIHSSENTEVEKTVLSHFVQSVDGACEAEKADNKAEASQYWSLAFYQVKQLLKGSYFDTIPNIIQKISYVYLLGLVEQARNLVNHIQASSLEYSQCGYPIASVFAQVGYLDLDHINSFECQMLDLIHNNFCEFFGSENLTTFMILKDKERRKLHHDTDPDPDACKDLLNSLDMSLGQLNVRPMEILTLRMERLFYWAEQKRLKGRDDLAESLYYEALNASVDLLERARLKRYDLWQHYYFQIKAYAMSGRAYLALKCPDCVRPRFELCIYLVDEFDKLSHSYEMFKLRRKLMKEELERL